MKIYTAPLHRLGFPQCINKSTESRPKVIHLFEVILANHSYFKCINLSFFNDLLSLLFDCCLQTLIHTIYYDLLLCTISNIEGLGKFCHVTLPSIFPSNTVPPKS